MSKKAAPIVPLTPEQAKMMEQNLGLAYKRGNHFWKNNLKLASQEDFVGEAMVGLAKAVQKFDPDKGWKFSTFAWRTIDNHLLNWLERHHGLFLVSGTKTFVFKTVNSGNPANKGFYNPDGTLNEVLATIEACGDVSREAIVRADLSRAFAVLTKQEEAIIHGLLIAEQSMKVVAKSQGLSHREIALRKRIALEKMREALASHEPSTRK